MEYKKQSTVKGEDVQAAVKSSEWQLNQQAKKYIVQACETTNARTMLGVLIGLSISNLILPYLVKIPILGFILEEFVFEAFEWGANMVPSVFLSSQLMTWQTNSGRWWLGVILALLALVPLVFSWKMTEKKLNTGGYWLAVIYYSVDSIACILSYVYSISEVFSADYSSKTRFFIILFCVLEVLSRAVVFGAMAEGIALPKKIKKEWNKMVDFVFARYALLNGEENAKKLPRIVAEKCAQEWIIGVQKKMTEQKQKYGTVLF
ncbi:MAG: hypothetical protein IJ046_00695 [Clostridia bacterium]|nr:hypothetical protein [Clostridia bacterium]